MTTEDRFTPKLGRPRDRGGRYAARLRKAAARKIKSNFKRSAKHSFPGAQIGRGSAAGRAAAFRVHPFAKFRMRRVIVKVHIARARKGIGRAAFRAHINYIQRDGVGRQPEGREGHGRGHNSGALYGRDKDKVEDKKFIERGRDDRHQFRIIVSPEDADALGDLKPTTRAFMARMEKDIGTRLDWAAVDHFNTGQLHTHIVIRGKDDRGRDLVIAKEYLTHGMRRNAQELVTRALGPRRDLDIARTRAAEVGKDRLTGIDRRIAAMEREGFVQLPPAHGVHDRMERTLAMRRLKHLQELKLATKLDADRWRMATGWREALTAMGRRGDIIRSLSSANGRDFSKLRAFVEDGPASILGRVIAKGPDDELRDTRLFAVETLDGHVWAVSPGEIGTGLAPPVGAIVEVERPPARARPSDRTIAAVAAGNDGRYSDDAHAAFDPAASPAYRLAHKRRLEGLRRAGIVAREKDGAFRLPENFLAKAAAFEARGARLQVKSWVAIDDQITSSTQTWLDEAEFANPPRSNFEKRALATKDRRLEFLRREGLMTDGEIDLQKLRANEAGALQTAATRLSGGRTYLPMEEGGSFDGVYERPVDLAHGRFALIARSREFTLAPWRPELETARGSRLSIRRAGRGVEWTFGQARGLTR